MYGKWSFLNNNEKVWIIVIASIVSLIYLILKFLGVE